MGQLNVGKSSDVANFLSERGKRASSPVATAVLPVQTASSGHRNTGRKAKSGKTWNAYSPVSKGANSNASMPPKKKPLLPSKPFAGNKSKEAITNTPVPATMPSKSRISCSHFGIGRKKSSIPHCTAYCYSGTKTNSATTSANTAMAPKGLGKIQVDNANQIRTRQAGAPLPLSAMQPAASKGWPNLPA